MKAFVKRARFDVFESRKFKNINQNNATMNVYEVVFMDNCVLIITSVGICVARFIYVGNARA